MKVQRAWRLDKAAISELVFKSLRPGVEISVLHESSDGARAAVLRYAPGAEVPEHLHEGNEYIYVLEGEQQDERGVYTAGSFVVNETGVTHRVTSPAGCLVLIVWQRPVVFV